MKEVGQSDKENRPQDLIKVTVNYFVFQYNNNNHTAERLSTRLKNV